MFLGGPLGFFHEVATVFGGRLWSLSSSIISTDLTNPNLEVCGPIPQGSTLVAVSIFIQPATNTNNGVLYLGLSRTDQTGIDALRAMRSLVNRSNPLLSGEDGGFGLRFAVGTHFRQLIPVGVFVDSGPIYVLFGMKFSSTADGSIFCCTWIWTPGGGQDRASAGGGTVLDSLRAAAADSL